MVEFFPIVPLSGKAWLWFWGIGTLLFALLASTSWIALGTSRTGFEVSPAGLHLRAPFYGRHVPAASLRADEAHWVDFRQEDGLRPRIRTNGIGMPGYLAGWVRMRNGDSALAFVTDWSRVVFVPTDQGFGILLSTPDPKAFLDRLRAVGG